MSQESDASGSTSTPDEESTTQPRLTVIVSSSAGGKRAIFPLPSLLGAVEVFMSIGPYKMHCRFKDGVWEQIDSDIGPISTI